MDEKTLTALQGSIAKWEAIVNGTGEDRGIDNCPLCREFHEVFFSEDDREAGRLSCSGCPVAIAAREVGCYQTPYDEIARLEDDDTEEYAAAAKAELEFLRSLLPSSK
jgi:hypothetical protein